MDAGILNRRVSIDRNYPAQDSSGDPVADWQPLATVWAAIAPLGGREADLGGLEVRSEVDIRLRLRYSPLTATLSPVDRIRYGSHIYNVVSAVDVDAAHVEMRIDAKTGLNDG